MRCQASFFVYDRDPGGSLKKFQWPCKISAIVVVVSFDLRASPAEKRFGHRRVYISKISFFQRQILHWFDGFKREFPWRSTQASLYHKIVSEVLLQRTKASTVAAFWPTFIEHYPSWECIAESSVARVEAVLQPIGLAKQRASRLHSLAKIMTERQGIFPKDRKEIEMLPGVGQYIANAIEIFDQQIPAALMDVNMARVMERFFGARKLADIRYDPFLQKLSARIVDHKSCPDLNWAILDFAALVCKARQPMCGQCLLKRKCRSNGSV